MKLPPLQKLHLRRQPVRLEIVLCAALASAIPAVQADSVFTLTGFELIRKFYPDLTGAAVPVLQPEAPGTLVTDWEVNPGAVGQSPSLFTWASTLGSATNYPNLVGMESAHANTVASLFYGSTGAAPGVEHVYEYEASYFYNSFVATGSALPAALVNQSFIFTRDEQEQANIAFDNYAARHRVLFISAAGNDGAVYPPGSGYNTVGVGAFDGPSSSGPTTDNARCKPDITAPGGFTSFSTPVVSGAAALLLQGAARGDGGASVTNAAVDPRVIKALLLNGAVKPSNWNHSATRPLDLRHGAGILNVFNSYHQLLGGLHSVSGTSTGPLNAAHTAMNTNSIDVVRGWDFAAISSTPTEDTANHYCFDWNPGARRSATFVATLVWHRQNGKTNINDLDLVLYHVATTNRMAISSSLVDNVEHLFVSGLMPGAYDLQVIKKGGTNMISASEQYALVFDFFTLSLGIALEGTNAVLSWPLSPAGFHLESGSDLNSTSVWENVSTTSSAITNGENRILLPAGTQNRFFRLRGP